MRPNTKKTDGFVRHIGTIMTEQEFVVAFFPTDFTVAVNNEKILCYRDAFKPRRLYFSGSPISGSSIISSILLTILFLMEENFLRDLANSSE